MGHEKDVKKVIENSGSRIYDRGELCTMTIYLDEIFAVNLLMDWLILWAVSHFAQYYSRWWRLWLAAILGAVYSVAVCFPQSMWITALPVKIAWSLLMLLIAFSFVNWRNYLKFVIYFYLCAFVLGGSSMAVMYLFGQPVMQTWSGVALMTIDFELFWLAVGAGVIIASIYCLRGRLRQDLSAARQYVMASLYYDGKWVSVQLLIDSGHSLTDPLTGRSVIVAEQRRLLPLFSDAVQRLLEESAHTKAERMLELSEQPGMTGRWRIIPYQTVGQQGLLLGFRPDSITLQHNHTIKTVQNHIVALSAQPFSSDGTYQGLISLDLL